MGDSEKTKKIRAAGEGRGRKNGGPELSFHPRACTDVQGDAYVA